MKTQKLVLTVSFLAALCLTLALLSGCPAVASSSSSSTASSTSSTASSTSSTASSSSSVAAFVPFMASPLIDNFEGYANTAALNVVWNDAGAVSNMLGTASFGIVLDGTKSLDCVFSSTAAAYTLADCEVTSFPGINFSNIIKGGYAGLQVDLYEDGFNNVLILTREGNGAGNTGFNSSSWGYNIVPGDATYLTNAAFALSNKMTYQIPWGAMSLHWSTTADDPNMAAALADNSIMTSNLTIISELDDSTTAPPSGFFTNVIDNLEFYLSNATVTR